MLSLLLFSYSSCTDQGCIEADDFGEYEQEVLTVKANNLGGTCEYFPSKSISDAEQGSGLKECFTQGTKTIADENGDEQTGEAGSGCGGFPNFPTVQQLCIEKCIQICIAGSQSASGSAEPDWIATQKKEAGRNIGVTVTPGAEIIIRAIGTIVLGGFESEPIYTRASYGGLQSRDENFSSPAFIDILSGVARTVKFSGKWDGDTGAVGNFFGGNVTSDPSTFNGARRLAAFLIPHPEGYIFNTDAADEYAGTKGVPLFADDSLWKCDYTGSVLTESFCYGDAAQGTYGISSANPAPFSQKINLGTSGGMIRWENDGLVDLASISGGTSIGDLSSSGTNIINNEPHAFRVLLQNTSGNANCNLSNLQFSINGAATINASVGNSFLSTSPYITLEPGQNITFASNATDNGSGVNCGSLINYKLLKLQDIKINKSGFVSFTNLGGSVSNGTCALKGRIINPVSISGDLNGPADFYEYDNFDTVSSKDPLDNLSIPTSTASPKSWSNKVFVRKGQIIRLDPASWNGSWSVVAGQSRQCGVGMAMKVGGVTTSVIGGVKSAGSVEDRPAFLCKGARQENVSNPDCTLGLDGSNNEICQSYSAACFDSGSTGASGQYCPDEDCQVASPNSACVIAPVTSAQCIRCYNAKEAAGAQSTNVSILIDQCYDLENYTGRVSDIPDGSATGSVDGIINSQVEMDAVDNVFAKGGKKLGVFNGSYGNFESFSDSGEVDGVNKVYTSKQLIYPSNNGRLMFLIIDNDDFTTDFDNDFNPGNGTTTGNYQNNSMGSSYSESNGYKIDLTGQQEFKNGQWLEAILCQETSDTSTTCSSATIPAQVSGQPLIIKIADPTTVDQGPKILSHYKFDEFGSLVRFANIDATGVNPNINGLFQTTIGDFFYRHGHEEEVPNESKAQKDARQEKISRLRLSFKIKDSDNGNCIIAAPAINQDCSVGACNGLVTQNPFYIADRASPAPVVSGNDGTICLANTPVGNSEDDTTTPILTHCQKQFFCASKYLNNSGEYQVVVKVKNNKTNISGLVDQVISPVIEILDGAPDGSTVGQAERVYRAVVGDIRFQAIISICLVIMIAFYGVGYLMGVSEFSQSEILARIIKIGVIFLFIGPNGWEFFDRFFVEMFKSGTDYITFLMASAFDRSTELQNAIANNDFSNKAILFGGVDEVFGMFFSSAVQNKIWAMFFASIFGPIYLFIIYLSFFLYIFAVANAVLLYLTAQIFISILFILGPIFFIMLMFNQTKNMFDKWLGELIGFSLQQIFLLTTLAFFNMMMYEIIKISLGYRICWDDVWVLNLGITRVKLLSFWTISSMPTIFNTQSDVGNIGNPEGIPSLFSILFIWIIASLMLKFVEFMTDLGASIGGSVRVTQLSSGIKDDASAIWKGAKSYASNSMPAQFISNKIATADRVLFNSGKEADKARADKRKQKQDDSKSSATLNKSRTEGEKQFDKDQKTTYKRADGTQKSDTEINADRKLAGKEAMMKKGKDMGLNDEAIKRITGPQSKFDAIKDAENVWDVAKGLYRVGKMNRANKDKGGEVSLETFGKMIKGASKEEVDNLKKREGGAFKIKSSGLDKAKLHGHMALESASDRAESFGRSAFSATGKLFRGEGKSIKTSEIGEALRSMDPRNLPKTDTAKGLGYGAKGALGYLAGGLGKALKSVTTDMVSDASKEKDPKKTAYGQQTIDAANKRLQERKERQGFMDRVVGAETKSKAREADKKSGKVTPEDDEGGGDDAV